MKYVIAIYAAILLAGCTSYKLHTNNNLVAYAEKYGDFGYEYVAPYFTITNYSGSNANVIIPPDINGTYVTSIGVEAFFGGIKWSFCKERTNSFFTELFIIYGHCLAETVGV